MGRGGVSSSQTRNSDIGLIDDDPLRTTCLRTSAAMFLQRKINEFRVLAKVWDIVLDNLTVRALKVGLRQMAIGLFRSHPVVWIAPLCLLFVLVGVTEFAVAYAAKQQASAQQNIDRQLAGLAVEGIAQMFREGYWMVLALKAQVLAAPFVPDLRKLFNQTAAELIARGPGPSIYLSLLPMGRILMTYPNYPAGASAIGLDFLNTPFGRDPRFATAFAQDIPLLQFFTRPSGQVHVNIGLPITIANVSATELFGMNRDVSYCPNPAGCYDPVRRARFWGGVIASVDLGLMFQAQDVLLSRLREEGLDYQLLVPANVVLATDSLTEDMVVAQSPAAHDSVQGCEDIVTVSAMLPSGDAWTLKVWRLKGNYPAWRIPLLATMPLLCLILAAELLVVLVSSYRHGELVRAMLPPAAARCLAAGQEYAEAFDGVTILFADICSYTTISSELTPRQVVALLSGLYDRFDKLCEKHGMYKVEIVGDCWMAASGAFPHFAPREAALRAARQALDMVRVAEAYTTEDGRRVQIRVGLASGPVFASVISQKMAHVTLIGNTTNVAARMESSCKPMHIHVAESTAALLHPALANTNSPQHHLERRASVPPGLASAASCELPATSPRSFLEDASNNQGFSSMSSVQVCVNIDTDTSKAASCCTSGPAEELLAGSSVEVADADTGCTLHLLARGPQNIKGKG
ncbi:hypothetical protein V8C86DRAFT_2724640 [Haematococcus lacustris]